MVRSDEKRMRSIIEAIATTDKSLITIATENNIDYSTVSGIRKALEYIDIANEYDLSSLKEMPAVKKHKFEFNGKKQLSSDTVSLICELLEYDFISNIDISKATGGVVSKAVISGIRNGGRYKDISKNYSLKKCKYIGCPGAINRNDYAKRKKILDKAEKKFDKLKKSKRLYNIEYYESLER